HLPPFPFPTLREGEGSNGGPAVPVPVSAAAKAAVEGRSDPRPREAPPQGEAQCHPRSRRRSPSRMRGRKGVSSGRQESETGGTLGATALEHPRSLPPRELRSGPRKMRGRRRDQGDHSSQRGIGRLRRSSRRPFRLRSDGSVPSKRRRNGRFSLAGQRDRKLEPVDGGDERPLGLRKDEEQKHDPPPGEPGNDGETRFPAGPPDPRRESPSQRRRSPGPTRPQGLQSIHPPSERESGRSRQASRFQRFSAAEECHGSDRGMCRRSRSPRAHH
ncbi:unnamed protein product, partial [Darwinula stevensoni]